MLLKNHIEAIFKFFRLYPKNFELLCNDDESFIILNAAKESDIKLISDSFAAFRMIKKALWLFQNPRKFKYYLSFLAIMLLLTFGVNAQKTDFQLKRFSVKEGLPSPKINVLYEDSRQQLWIGTNTGLVSYNGYEFKHFSLEEGLKSETVLAIMEDAEGGIWVGGNKGIVIVEGDSCHSLPINLVENTYYLNRDFEGNMWISNGEFLYYYANEKILKYHQTKDVKDLQPKIFQPEDCSYIFALAQDEMGSIYLSDSKGIARINQQQKIERLYQKNGRESIPRQLLPWSQDSLFWGDKRGNVYLTTPDSTKLIKQFCNNEMCGLVDMTKWKNTLTLLFDQNILFYKNNGATRENLLPESWNIKGRRCMLTDKKGNLWIGTTEGLVLITSKLFHDKQYPKEFPEIYSLLGNEEGLLLGTNQGKIFQYSIDSQPFFTKKVRPAGEIMDMITDHLGGTWFVSYWRGASRYFEGDLQGFFYGDFSEEEPDLFCILEDKKWNIWFGGVNSIFKMTMDWEKGEAKKIKRIFLPKRDFHKLVEDEDGTIWAASSNGLFKIIADSLVLIDLKTVPINTNFTDAFWDGDNLWLTTQGAGVIHCKKLESGNIKVIKKLTVENGLRNNFVQCIEQDAQGNIWVGTYMGLSSIDVKSFLIHNYDQDGLTEQPYFNITLYRDKNDQMWCATTEGLFSFNPTNFNFSKSEMHSHFSEIQVNSQPLKNYKPQSFSYNQNSFKFSFLHINTSYADLILYRYRLKGLTESWSTPSNLREARYDFLPVGNYEFEVQTSSAHGEWSTKNLQYSFKIEPPFWSNIWLQLFSLFAFISIIGAFLNWRIKKIKKQEQEKSKARQLITELESRALRAQMNPHFVFNCMNAIQEQILMKEIQSAYTYLSKFAKLMRMVLNNSKVHAITIENEIIMLKLYLELESLRFDDAFDYSIDCEEDASFLELPSLMIQPFVENAIWHGLLPKKGNKKLHIKFTLLENSILCSIQDNGIGRSASVLRQKNQTKEHQSHAIQLVEERLALINKNSKEKATLRITDLMSDNEIPTGTLVEINLPVDWQNNKVINF